MENYASSNEKRTPVRSIRRILWVLNEKAGIVIGQSNYDTKWRKRIDYIHFVVAAICEKSNRSCRHCADPLEFRAFKIVSIALPT